MCKNYEKFVVFLKFVALGLRDGPLLKVGGASIRTLSERSCFSEHRLVASSVSSGEQLRLIGIILSVWAVLGNEFYEKVLPLASLRAAVPPCLRARAFIICGLSVQIPSFAANWK